MQFRLTLFSPASDPISLNEWIDSRTDIGFPMKGIEQEKCGFGAPFVDTVSDKDHKQRFLLLVKMEWMKMFLVELILNMKLIFWYKFGTSVEEALTETSKEYIFLLSTNGYLLFHLYSDRHWEGEREVKKTWIKMDKEVSSRTFPDITTTQTRRRCVRKRYHRHNPISLPNLFCFLSSSHHITKWWERSACITFSSFCIYPFFIHILFLFPNTFHPLSFSIIRGRCRKGIIIGSEIPTRKGGRHLFPCPLCSQILWYQGMGRVYKEARMRRGRKEGKKVFFSRDISCVKQAVNWSWSTFFPPLILSSSSPSLC